MADQGGDQRLSRRRLLEGTLGAGALLTVPGLLAACGGDGSGGAAATSAPATTAAPPATSAAATSAAATSAAETAAASTAAATAGTRGGNLRLAVSGGGVTETVDPHRIVNAPDQARSLNLFDRLTETTDDLQIQNTLAETIEANADATEWQVTLKDGVTFHDGSPLTADDVIWSLKRIGLDPEQPYYGNLDMFDLEAAKKVDDRTVIFPLKRPYGDLPRLFAGRYLSIVKDGTSDFTDVKNVIGTGPFKLTAFTPGERTTMVRHDGYWRDVWVDQVDLISIDPEAQLNALIGQQVDGIESLPAAQAIAQDGKGQIQVVTLPGQDVPNWTMRLDQKPFDDPRVREAMRLAVDRQAMIDTIFLGRGTVGNDLHGLAYPSYNGGLEQRPHDPERARALLAEAGYPDGIEVELITGLFVNAATALKEQAKAAGITIKLKKVSADEVYNTDLYYLKAPFGETSWGADSFEFIAPQGYLSDAPYNETAWKRPAFDDAFKKAVGIVDPDERNAAFAPLQEELWNEGGYIVWGYGDGFYGLANNVQGLTARPGFAYAEFHFERAYFA